MKEYSSEEIEYLLKRFNDNSLPKVEWTHEAHLIMGIWYISKYSQEKSLEIIRSKIKKLNDYHGTANSDTEGYHESITLFWLIVTSHFIKKNSALSLYQLCNTFINSEESHRNYPMSFYTARTLFSNEARRKWVEPDIIPLL